MKTKEQLSESMQFAFSLLSKKQMFKLCFWVLFKPKKIKKFTECINDDMHGWSAFDYANKV